jgi:hypothetical protein
VPVHVQKLSCNSSYCLGCSAAGQSNALTPAKHVHVLRAGAAADAVCTLDLLAYNMPRLAVAMWAHAVCVGRGVHLLWSVWVVCCVLQPAALASMSVSVTQGICSVSALALTCRTMPMGAS